MRRAIAALAERGLVRAERGSGTFIEQRRIAYPIRARTRFSEIVGGAGHTVGGRLMASTDRELPRIRNPETLRLPVGTPVVRLELLRHADRIPLSAATTWLRSAAFSGRGAVYASTNSTTRMLARFGVRNYSPQKHAYDGGDCRIRPMRRCCKFAIGRPLLVVDSVDVDGDGVPVLTTRARFAADRIELMIDT